MYVYNTSSPNLYLTTPSWGFPSAETESHTSQASEVVTTATSIPRESAGFVTF